ncbi:MAG: DegT/DnrJ/EryC1/StrS family aminotransferase [Aeoliella sp.]
MNSTTLEKQTKNLSSTQRTAAKTPPPSERLAIYGGPKAVQRKYSERWKHLRLRDLSPALPYIAMGHSTIPTGGILTRFESAFSKMTGANYSLMMNSGTATLHSAYFAVGLRPGDEVIVPAYTFFASAAPILQFGATPVFCDVDENTLTADPDDVEKRITAKTRAICVVHVWGNPARLDRFVDIAKRHNIALIEDASHAHGATYNGQPVGTFGDIGCFSLQGSKAVSGGEAGIAITNNVDYYERMLSLGHNFRDGDFVTGKIDLDGMNLGLKYRPHLCAVALATSSLRRLPKLNRLRQQNYAILSEELAGCDAVIPIATYPGAKRGGFLKFVLRYRPEKAAGWCRDTFVAAAQAEGVKVVPDRYTMQSATGRLLNEAPLFNELAESNWAGMLSEVKQNPLPRDVRLPVSQQLADELLTLPSFTRVNSKYIVQTATALKKVASAALHIGDYRTGEYGK